jgi:hypothetical protein
VNCLSSEIAVLRKEVESTAKRSFLAVAFVAVLAVAKYYRREEVLAN